MGTLSAIAALLTPLVSLVVDDLVVNTSALHTASFAPFWNDLIRGFEAITGMAVNDFLGPALLGAAALVCTVHKPWQKQVRPLVFVAACWALARLGVGLLKLPFGRVRPHRRLAEHDVGAVSAFFRGGGSFPSGQAAHAFGLCLPLSLLFPRWAILFLGLAALVAVARVAVNDHYVADVLASLAWAALVTWLLARLLVPRTLAPPKSTRARRAA
jgi:membrane-associated phospholipid phosphatase